MGSKLLIPNNSNDAINQQYLNIIKVKDSLKNKGGMEEIFNKEIIKIQSINNQIGILEQKLVTVNSSRKLKEILPKYITFLKYIKKIIQVKIIKDITIVNLINDVFIKVDEVIGKIKDTNYGIYTPNNNELQKKRKELQNLTKRKKPKIYLVDIGEIEYKSDITQLENCTTSINSELKEAISKFNEALQPITEGGASDDPKNTFSLNNNNNDETKKFYNALYNNNNVFNTINTIDLKDKNALNDKEKNVLIVNHTKKLNDIKDKYEKGLQTNIANFKNICDALKQLIGRIKEITSILTNKKIQVITLNKNNVDALQREINDLKQQEDPVTIKGLKISDFQDAEIFKKNHEALEGLLDEINNKTDELKDPQNTTQPPSQAPVTQGQARGNPPQAPVLGLGNTGSSQGQPQGNLGNSGQPGNNTSSEISSAESLMSIIDKLDNVNVNKNDINEAKNMQTLNALSEQLKKLYPTNTNSKQLEKDFNSIGNIPIEGTITDEDIDIEKYNRIVDRINKEGNTRLDQLAIYIYVMQKYQNADNIKKKLYEQVRIKGLFSDIDRIQLDKISQTAGKSKKSKNYKKSSKSKTSKKAKSTKKQKTPGTQVKSYNNPKYKNQDGGFVRGGVLFPESFYRSDIVM